MSELAFNRAILERNNQVLSWVSLVSLAINIALAIALSILLTRPPLIVFEKNDQIHSVNLEDFQLNEEILKDFTRMISREYLSFTPTSLPLQVEGISKYLTSQPLESILESYERNQEKIKKRKVFHQFTINRIEIVSRKNPFKVLVSGLKTIYVGGNQRSMNAQYLFELKQIKPTESNPYGLLVTQITETKDTEKEASS